MTASPPASSSQPFGRPRRQRIWSLIWERLVRVFFGANAFVAILVLGMIMLFLLREGLVFFRIHHENLMVYRRAGLELVDHLRTQEKGHAALTRYLFDLRVRSYRHYTEKAGLSAGEANQALASLDEFSYQFGETVEPLSSAIIGLGDLATAIKIDYLVNRDRMAEKAQLTQNGRIEEATQLVLAPVDFAAELKPILSFRPLYPDVNARFTEQIEMQLHGPQPMLPAGEIEGRFRRFHELVQAYLAGFPAIEQEVASWDSSRPVPYWKAWTSFLTGTRWLTASFWQDWYGVLPLLAGSVMVSMVALLVAVPFGVGAAVYVNQFASVREQNIVKPCIEFIAAIPSVVLGFFGIVVLGEFIRNLSQGELLSWLPGFPITERLNVLTAGLLLALMAVPTIFTLAEDALQRVPRAFREASFALGATRWQTVRRVVFPMAHSGVVSAILLGLGRVIGETMIVLLCAGNRISIPDFTEGLSAFTQPMHTMTGIIAQEMGEVVQGGIHYRALFMVGVLLFFITLSINYMAERMLRRHRLARN